MPIQEITRGLSGPEIKKVCQHCGEVASIAADSLTLGGEYMPSTIKLPPCAKCAAVETLNRTTDANVPDHLSAHRRTVNALSEYLQSKGKIAASAEAHFADQKAKGIKATPLGELYARVVPVKLAQAPSGAMAMALQALAAAQAAVAAAKAQEK